MNRPTFTSKAVTIYIMLIQLLFVYTSLCIYELSERDNFVSHILADGTDLNVNIQIFQNHSYLQRRGYDVQHNYF